MIVRPYSQSHPLFLGFTHNIYKLLILKLVMVIAKRGSSSDAVGSSTLGSDAWNVAEGYTKLKILKQLIFLDRYENIALYGVDDMDEDEAYDESAISKKRETALLRYVSTLKQLLGNVEFAIGKEDQAKIKGFRSTIEEIEEYLDGVSYVRINQVANTSELKINEIHMKICIDILQNIKNEINKPINKAGLIFRESDEVNIDQIMKEIEAGG